MPLQGYRSRTGTAKGYATDNTSAFAAARSLLFYRLALPKIL